MSETLRVNLRRPAVLASLSLALVGLAAVPAHAAGSPAGTSPRHRAPGMKVPVRVTAGPSTGRAALRGDTSVVGGDPATTKYSTWQVTYSGGFLTNKPARDAFQAAVDMWAGIVHSSVPIRVSATFKPLGAGVLGAAGPFGYTADPGIGDGVSYYPDALADALAGTDTYTYDPSVGANPPDIEADFNSSYSYSLHTDGSVDAGKVDLESVVLHELGHGLGLTSAAGYDDNMTLSTSDDVGFFDGAPSRLVYDKFLVNSSNAVLFRSGASHTLATAFTSPVYWNGANAKAADGGVKPVLYAPSPWLDGSSIAHLDEDVYGTGNVDSLMTPYLSKDEAVHRPGPITVGMFRDLGWTMTLGAPDKVTGVAVVPSPTQMALSWDKPAENGSAVTGYTVSYSDDGQPQTPISTAATSLLVPATTGHTYSFSVRASNAVGNGPASDVTAPVSAGTDSTPPSVSFAGSASFTQPDDSLTFTGSDPGRPNDTLTFQCGLDTTSLTSCSSPLSFTGLSQGDHTLNVQATDVAGNPSTVAQHPFTVDTTAPTVNITGGPDSKDTWVGPTQYTFSGSDGQSGVTYRCGIDTATPATPCASPYTVPAVSQGLHTFNVVAVDAAGNVSDTASHDFRYDAANPTIAPVALTPYNLNSAVGLRYSGTDTGGSGVTAYDVRYRKAAFNGTFPSTYTLMTPPAGTTALITTIPAAKGYTYCFQAQSHDATGRVSGWSADRCTATALDDRALAASSGWGRGTGAPYYGSTVTATTKAGQVLTRTGVQARRVYLVVTTCRGCGSVDVLWNGARIARISLNATTTTYKRVIGVYDFGAVRSGTLQVKTINTGRTYIDGVDLSRV